MTTTEGESRHPQAQTGPPLERAYLIRCWQERDAALSCTVQWRFSAEEVLHERIRRGFADAASLLDYLRAELDNKN